MLLRSSSFYRDSHFKSKLYPPSSLYAEHFMWNPNVSFLCTDVSLTAVCYMSSYRCLGFAFNGSPRGICIRWPIGQHWQWANEVWQRPVWEWRGSGKARVQRREAALSSGEKDSCWRWRLEEVCRCVRFGSWPLTLFSVTTPRAIGDWSPPASPTLLSPSVFALPSDSLSFIASLCKCQFACILLLSSLSVSLSVFQLHLCFTLRCGHLSSPPLHFCLPCFLVYLISSHSGFHFTSIFASLNAKL